MNGWTSIIIFIVGLLVQGGMIGGVLWSKMDTVQVAVTAHLQDPKLHYNLREDILQGKLRPPIPRPR